MNQQAADVAEADPLVTTPVALVECPHRLAAVDGAHARWCVERDRHRRQVSSRWFANCLANQGGGGYGGPAVVGDRVYVMDYLRKEGALQNDPGSQ